MGPRLDFELVKPSEAFLHPGSFLKKFDYADDHERQYVKQIADQAKRRQKQIYLLSSSDQVPHGFVAISISVLQNQPCLVIDYLFTSKAYRGEKYEKLGDKRISEYLVDFSVQVALEIDSKAPIRFVALTPIHDNLRKFYEKWGFKSLDKTDWLFLKIE
jgi:hypothetical protein